MKKLVFLIMILSFALCVKAQNIQKNEIFSKDVTIFEKSYNAILDDDIDSMYIDINLNKDYMPMYNISIIIDTVSGADTTVVYQLYGKVFDYENWTQISTATSSAISSQTVINLNNIAGATWQKGVDSTYVVKTLAGTPYRKLQTRIIRKGDDSTGEGILIKSLHCKLYQPQF